MDDTKTLITEEIVELLAIIETRFHANMSRHPEVFWQSIQKTLQSQPSKLWSLAQMELSGGEPDVVENKQTKGKYQFVDCSAESPLGRRNLCYDPEALASRKKNKPQGSAVGEAMRMGLAILTEDEYRNLQTFGDFDLKTSSWIYTPSEVRKKGGALFCDRRYDHVFTYHNGAESYYAARGFRASLTLD